MKAVSSSSYRSWICRSALVAIPLGLAACGSSSPPPQAPPPAVGGGPASLPAGLESAGPLLNSVTTAVPGLSPTQAATGTGALLALAQQKMPPEQFAQIANSMPGTDALIGGAVKSGLPTSGLTGLSSLSGTFASAGISQQQVSQMIPALGNEISKKAGSSAGKAFLSAVK